MRRASILYVDARTRHVRASDARSGRLVAKKGSRGMLGPFPAASGEPSGVSEAPSAVFEAACGRDSVDFVRRANSPDAQGRQLPAAVAIVHLPHTAEAATQATIRPHTAEAATQATIRPHTADAGRGGEGPVPPGAALRPRR